MGHHHHDGEEHDHDHDHVHDHDHDHEGHDHSACSPGEDYERNLEEQRRRTVSRRTMLRAMGAAGLIVAGGGLGVTNVSASNIEQPAGVKAAPFVAEDNDDFYYLSGDHHIHTRYSSDAKYTATRQIAEGTRFGLDWLVLTDHGNLTHNKLGVDQIYPDILAGREAFKNTLVFTGLELNIPGAEHGTVMMMPAPGEYEYIKDFELNFDGAIAVNSEEGMLAALRYLNKVDPKPLFFANHPSRRGLDSPHEIRNWKLTAPDIAYGFEGAPGHQAAGMIKDADGKYVSYRGFYGNKAGDGAWPGFTPESYFTYGGFDYMTAKLGGLWDSLLGDGLRWWITCNSDSHKYFYDLQDVDTKDFDKIGYVKEIDKYFLQPVNGDFAPGEYSRTYVITNDRSYAGVMGGIRQGNMFVVNGDLIDRLRFYATVKGPGERDFGGAGVLTGGTLVVKPGSDVRVQVRFRTPKASNSNNDRPRVDHFDLISGLVTNQGYVPGNADLFANPTTKVAQTYTVGDWRASETATGYIVEAEYIFRNVRDSFYARLRGTNTTDYGETPAIDADLRGKTGDMLSPWDSLWFYSNPIFVVVEGSNGVQAFKA